MARFDHALKSWREIRLLLVAPQMAQSRIGKPHFSFEIDTFHRVGSLLRHI